MYEGGGLTPIDSTHDFLASDIIDINSNMIKS
jgi:hypothetical protein